MILLQAKPNCWLLWLLWLALCSFYARIKIGTTCISLIVEQPNEQLVYCLLPIGLPIYFFLLILHDRKKDIIICSEELLKQKNLLANSAAGDSKFSQPAV